MPHLTIDYSANIEAEADIAGLCETLRATAAGMDVFPEAGVRVRAFRADFWAVGDGKPENGFIDVSVRLREGRPQDVKAATTEALFSVITAHLADVIANRAIAVSLEMREIDALLAPKVNTIRVGG